MTGPKFPSPSRGMKPAGLLPRAFLLFAAAALLASAPIAQEPVRTVHAFVALCDNASQGIVPVPPRIGDGDDPESNLYWGSAEGLRTQFCRSRDWKLAGRPSPGAPWILDRCVFRHVSGKAYLVADAYRGSEIRRALADFLAACLGEGEQEVRLTVEGRPVVLACGGKASLVVYLGHNGLMDFPPPPLREAAKVPKRPAAVLCCMSESYFGPLLRPRGADLILTTRQLMYPGAFLLQALLEGWLKGEDARGIRESAAQAYSKNQGISVAAAMGIFADPGKPAAGAARGGS